MTQPWELLGPPPPSPAECPHGPHRGPEGPYEAAAMCARCWGPDHVQLDKQQVLADAALALIRNVTRTQTGVVCE